MAANPYHIVIFFPGAGCAISMAILARTTAATVRVRASTGSRRGNFATGQAETNR
jgi:hypothetical protein